VTGWGAGEYALQYLDRLGTVLPSDKDHKILQSVVFAREAHNDPIQFAAEFGLIGIALLAGIIVAGWHFLSRQKWDFRRQGIMLAFVFSYMSVASLFSFSWQSAMAGPLAGLLLGMCLQARATSLAASKMIRLTLRGCNTLVLLLAILLFAWCGRDAYLNLMIPARLAADDTDGAAQRLSRVDYRYHALVGAAQATKGQNDAALNTLLHARRGYRDVLLWNNLGHVLTRKNEWRDAQAVYKAWTASGLDHANAQQNLSVASEQTGDVSLAADSLSKRMRLWPDAISADDVKRLAVLQLRVAAPRDAAETMRRYRAKWQYADPKTVAEMENLAGSISRILGDNDQAVIYFQSALERYPELDSARKNLDAVEGKLMFEPSAAAYGEDAAAEP
jgi:tetratricopeptide (TPR) repeat protein